MENKDALVLVISRNTFYKQLHFLALGAFALSVVVIFILFYIVYYLTKNPTGPLYFATDVVSRIIPIIPVSKPNMSTDDVTAWTVDAIESTLSYDFVNYRAQFQNAQKFFTNYGWTNYMKSVQGTGNILALTDRNMIVLAKVIGKPKVLAEGLLAGAYAWKFQMQVLITYLLPPYDDKPGTSKFTNPLEASVIVQRQQVLQGYRGLGIVQIVANIVATPTAQPQEISATPTP